jgi:DNA (cytosine-5)-methyltransferase 1
MLASEMPSIKAINAKAAKSKLNAVSFFSGMGGGSIGLKLGGFRVRYANEFIGVAADSYEANSDIKVDRRDIRKVTAKSVYAMSGVPVGAIDIIESSPPCKVFSSTQARKAGRDFGEQIDYSEGVKQQVDDLFFEFCRVLKRLQSKVFIAENVPGLIKAINRGYFVEIHAALTACGYNVQAAIVDPSRLGLPQKRERLIFMGIRNDVYRAGFKHCWPRPQKYETTVAECLPHIKRIKTSRGYKTSKNPSPTLTASDHSIGETANFSCGGFCETADGKTRKYTIEELKVLSGVPKDFKFVRQPKESDNKHFIRCWERLGRIHSPLSVFALAREIRTKIIEPYNVLKRNKAKV